MKILFRIAIIISLFSYSSCKNKKSATTTSSNTTQETSAKNSTPPADDSYRLVVSFYSTAAGIDPKAHSEFVKFLTSYPKKIVYTPTPWGREGEVDYCLKLSELSTSEQADFIKKTNELLSSSKLVHINENAKCVHKH